MHRWFEEQLADATRPARMPTLAFLEVGTRVSCRCPGAILNVTQAARLRHPPDAKDFQ